VRGVPGHLGAFGDVVDAQPHALEYLRQRQAAFPHHLGQRLRVGSVRTLTFGRDGPGRRVEGDQHAGIRLDQRQTAGERRARLRERIGARRIDDHDARFELQRRQWSRVVGNAHRFHGDIRVARDLGVDGNEVILAFELQAVAGDIHHRHGIGSCAARLVEEIAQGAAQRILIEITRAHHVEARGLEGLRDQARVVGRRVERAGLVSGIADHERDALFRARCARGER